MIFDISAEVRFAFNPSMELIDMLIELASHHYDAKCKSLAKDVYIDGDNYSGLLHKWKRIINSYDGELPTTYQPITATWHQLDILLKVMELRSYLGSEEKKSMIDDLAMDFILAMNAYKAKHNEWKFTIDTSDK